MLFEQPMPLFASGGWEGLKKVEQVRRPATAINKSHCFREKEQVNENNSNTDKKD